MRHVRISAAMIGALLATICISSCSNNKKDAGRSSSSSSSSSTTLGKQAAPIVRVHVPADEQLRSVVNEWTRRNKVAGAVVGVQVANRPPIYVTYGKAPVTPAVPRRLLAYSDTSFRAHVRGETDLARSFFEIGPNGTSTSQGVQGVSNDGFCGLSPAGCPPGARFFAVGAFRPVAGGSAVIVYDPVYDISVVAVSRSSRTEVGDLAFRADLLTKLGVAGYRKAVSNTARTVPGTSAP